MTSMTSGENSARDSLGDGMVLPKGFLSDDERTFQYQASLPSLPIPPLQDTLNKYLISVRPHLTDEEFAHTKAVMGRFAEGEGPGLQARLMARAQHKRNWIESWWEDYGYLKVRDPHEPFINFSGPGPYMDSYWAPKDGTQTERGALITWFAIKYWQLIRKQRLKVDRGGKKVIWCMNQYHRMFNGCKTPGHEKDTLNHYFKTEDEGECPSHVVTICKGRIFTFDACHPDGSVLSAPEMQKQFDHIQRECDHLGQGPGLGVLTSENRTTWAKLREHLIGLHPDNERHLVSIQTAIMVLVLDDRTPQTTQDLANEGLMGDAVNRWYDKTVQFVYFKNGTCTCNGDHAPYDAIIPVIMLYATYSGVVENDYLWKHAPCEAMVMINMMNLMYNGIASSQLAWQGRQNILHLDAPRELQFHLDTTITAAIEQAVQQYAVTSTMIELSVTHFTDYGKKFLRKHNIHPDTYIQMAIQLTYYRKYGRPAPTYETASARKFFHGRTETVRSCTQQSLDWSKAMLNPNVQDKERRILLNAAMDNHLKLMADAVELKGVDRHLLGLQLTALEDGSPTPEIFTDPAYTKSGGGGSYVLSTSFVGFTPCFGGVAPMCKNGYGVFYSIMDNRINVYISSWREDADTSSRGFYDALTVSLDEMRKLLESSKADSSKL